MSKFRVQILNTNLGFTPTFHVGSMNEVEALRENEFNRNQHLYAGGTFVFSDVTAEIAAHELQMQNDELAKSQLKSALKSIKKSDLNSIDSCADAIVKIIKHLKLD